MSEVVLHLDDESNVEKIMKAISPYFQNVSITTMPLNIAAKENAPKIWKGKADWLEHPWEWKEKTPFVPLTRNEIYDR